MKQINKFTIPLAAFALIATGALTSYAYQSHAQTTTTDSAQIQQLDQQATQGQQDGGHIGQNGVKEQELTGDAEQKATTAAQSAVSDGTIQRVETDAEGSNYEAHMTKPDGSQVTVKMDGNFQVTGTETGHGRSDR